MMNEEYKDGGNDDDNKDYDGSHNGRGGGDDWDEDVHIEGHVDY